MLLSTCLLGRRAGLFQLFLVEALTTGLEQEGFLYGVPPARLVQLLLGVGDLLAGELLPADGTRFGEFLRVFHDTPPFKRFDRY